MFCSQECEGQTRSGPHIVEPGGGGHSPLNFAVARVLIEPRDGQVPMRLLNPGSEEVSLHSRSVMTVVCYNTFVRMLGEGVNSHPHKVEITSQWS